ncbi:MAG: hypothetical protein COA76_13880 [Moritella sp.]|nr:MAG: hypothetical protein COA76_13880 [Moritella sp.]
MNTDLLKHIKKLNDAGELGFFQDKDDVDKLSPMIGEDLVNAERRSHDLGQLYTKVRITEKGRKYLIDQVSLSRITGTKLSTGTATKMMKSWNDNGWLAVLGLLVSIGIFFLS